MSHASPVTLITAPSVCLTWLVTSHTYDLAGQKLSTTDPLGNLTSYSYADNYVDGSSSLVTDSYLTAITYANGASDHYFYYYPTGEPAIHRDWNSNTTSYSFADSLNRLKQILYPITIDGTPGTNNTSAAGYTQYNYIDLPGAFSVSSSTLQTGSTVETKVTNYDGLGRVINTKILNSTTGGKTANVDTVYDSLGRVLSFSNPYYTLSDPTYGITSFYYDSLSRKTAQVQPDFSSQLWSYAGNVTTFTDESLHQWIRTSDGLGRLTNVAEPGGLQTSYGYDVLNNLTSVNQAGDSGDTPRNRLFVYDAVSRLSNACNPEGIAIGSSCSSTGPWSATYVYDADGNVLTKTDARNVTISYKYDFLNRLLWKTSPGSVSSCFEYDGSEPNGIGRLVQEWTQSGTCTTPPSGSSSLFTLRTIQSYDAMGRILSEQQCTPKACGTASGPQLAYSYDLAGEPTSLTNSAGANGSSLTLTTGYDAATHVKSITSNWSAFPENIYTLQTSPTYGYGPVGPLYWSMGTGLSLAQTYNNRRWVNSLGATSTAPQ
jgi:YD repeat-containing protein